jgi:hypothetical protein
MQRTSSSLRYMNCGPGHMQCNYSSAFPDFSIQLNVSALLMDMSRKFNESYTAIWVPNTAHVLQFTLCGLWSRDIQYNYSSAYSGFNIQLHVTALLFEVSRQFTARYTTDLVPNAAHTLQLSLYELWSRTYAM